MTLAQLRGFMASLERIELDKELRLHRCLYFWRFPCQRHASGFLHLLPQFAAPTFELGFGLGAIECQSNFHEEDRSCSVALSSAF